VEIVSGLNSGDRIVVEGPAGLADGSRVKER
jgi:multidrug efflux pump subunit AcrA (membrane-fusion protein)